MTKGYLDAIDPTQIAGDGRPLLIEEAAEFLNRSRVSISFVVADQVAKGRGTLCYLYRAEGDGAPTEWLRALDATMAQKRIKSLSMEGPGGLAFSLIDDEHAGLLPKPEAYGCEVQYLTTGLSLGMATLVRLKTPT